MQIWRDWLASCGTGDLASKRPEQRRRDAEPARSGHHAAPLFCRRCERREKGRGRRACPALLATADARSRAVAAPRTREREEEEEEEMETSGRHRGDSPRLARCRRRASLLPPVSGRPSRTLQPRRRRPRSDPRTPCRLEQGGVARRAQGRPPHLLITRRPGTEGVGDAGGRAVEAPPRCSRRSCPAAGSGRRAHAGSPTRRGKEG